MSDRVLRNNGDPLSARKKNHAFEDKGMEGDRGEGRRSGRESGECREEHRRTRKRRLALAKGARELALIVPRPFPSSFGGIGAVKNSLGVETRKSGERGESRGCREDRRYGGLIFFVLPKGS
jgi:hypothetical protein